MNYHTIMEFMCNGNTAIYSGMAYGFLMSATLNDIKTNPLSTLLGASIYGFIYGIGSVFVHNLIGKPLNGMLPLCLAYSLVSWKFGFVAPSRHIRVDINTYNI